MDGAPDGKHAKTLGENGQGLLAPPKRTRAPKQTSPVERTYSIGTFEADGTRRQIAMRGTQFLEIINIAGQPHEHVCEQRLKLVRSTTVSGAAKQIAYQQLTLHDGTLLRIPYAQMDGRNGRPKENAKEHLKRMSLMRAADKGDANWKAAFGTNRGTAERANGGDDAAMRNRRLPAYGTHNKACWVADRKIAMAIDLLAHRRIESGQASPPAYPDVSGLLAA